MKDVSSENCDHEKGKTSNLLFSAHGVSPATCLPITLLDSHILVLQFRLLSPVTSPRTRPLGCDRRSRRRWLRSLCVRIWRVRPSVPGLA